MAFPPLVLLSDSQLLFVRDEDASFTSALGALAGPVERAAYLGASNGDRPEFYDLFVAAMGPLAPKACRHVPAAADEADLAYLDSADLLLLAGGDVQKGLVAFEKSGVARKIVDAYLRGALLIGVSAGAIQLGSAAHVPRATNGADSPETEALPGFRFTPFITAVHDEPDWLELRRAVGRQGAGARGIGIPAGGGAIFHRDGSLEPIRRALVEIVAKDDGGVAESLLVAGAGVPAKGEGEDDGPA